MASDARPPETADTPADALTAFISGSFSSAEVKLFGRSRGIPSNKDFHFFNNFHEFKAPVNEIKDRTTSCIRSIADSAALWGIRNPQSFPDDLDDALDWVVNLNDDFLERFSVELDGFKNLREDGIDLSFGSVKRDEGCSGSGASTVVNVVIKDEKATEGPAKVPFHIPTIPRPQDEYMIRVNNENKPFDHVLLEKSAYGSRPIHPLEKHTVESFIDRNIEGDPVKPHPLERTPFKLVETVNDLKQMAAKLRLVNEFAVDLEHNQYRSFQGLTCLMQISTRTEDFVVDTLKLRIQVGPYLRDIFKDPSKRKVMHGADRDIIWLQCDFGIYVCNLFDTGQASRVLQLERNSLEYLLHHFCGVTANKQYQNADWRLRPLPNEMVKYGREDTHYLLYIYDVMKRSLLSLSSNENDLLLEVYRRSAEICMQLYEKELLTETSYMHINGLLHAELDAEQLAVVAGLNQWRDTVARAEDESTGYILPNKTLIGIAKQMPLVLWKLKRLFKSKHTYAERNLRTILGIIQSSIANSAAFQSAVQQLKKARLEALALQKMKAVDDNMESIDDEIDSMEADPPPLECSLGATEIQVQSNDVSAMNRIGEESEVKIMTVTEVGCSSGLSSNKTVEEVYGDNQGTEKKETAASVQLLKKSTCAFRGLCGYPASKQKTTPYTSISEQVKNEDKINQNKSVEERNDKIVSASNSTMENGMKHEELLLSFADGSKGLQPESEAITEETVAPLELPSSLDKCFSSISESRVSQNCREQADDPLIKFDVEPFDYAAARKKMNFSEVRDNDKVECEESTCTSKSTEASKGSAFADVLSEEKSRVSQARRCQAFPPTGNRSMAYR